VINKSFISSRYFEYFKILIIILYIVSAIIYQQKLFSVDFSENYLYALLSLGTLIFLSRIFQHALFLNQIILILFLIVYILFLYLLNKDLFKFNQSFLVQFIKIIFVSLVMGIFFYFLITEFSSYLENDYSFKAIFILIFVFLSVLFYLLVSFLVKAFKLSDIRTKY